MSETCSKYGGQERSKQGLGGRPKRKNPLGIPTRRWRDNIEVSLLQVGWGLDWIDLNQDRDRWRALVNGVMNLKVP
jgi:hypothetical protein